jgi:hypothetical protein
MKPFVSTLLAASLAAASFAATAQPPGPGPWGWGWRFGPPGYYFQAKELDRAAVEKKAKEILGGAAKGQAWNTPAGTRIPIQSGKDVVGVLWEDTCSILTCLLGCCKERRKPGALILAATSCPGFRTAAASLPMTLQATMCLAFSPMKRPGTGAMWALSTLWRPLKTTF